MAVEGCKMPKKSVFPTFSHFKILWCIWLVYMLVCVTVNEENQLWKQYWETVLNKYRVKAQVPQGLFEYLGPCFGLKSATQNSSKWPQPHAACNAQHAQARAHNVAATL